MRLSVSGGRWPQSRRPGHAKGDCALHVHQSEREPAVARIRWHGGRPPC